MSKEPDLGELAAGNTEHPPNAQQLWDTLHAQPRFWPRFPHDEVIRWALAEFPAPGEQRSQFRILDAGCGAGRHTIFLSEIGFTAFGVDFSEPALNVARFRAVERGVRPEFLKAALECLPFDDSSFDGAVQWGVIYYGTAQHAASCLRELARVLRPGARALVMTRSPRDRRTRLGRQIGTGTYLIESSETNEKGFTMYFPDEEELEQLCGPALALENVELQERTVQNRTERDSDWLLRLRRRS